MKSTTPLRLALLAVTLAAPVAPSCLAQGAPATPPAPEPKVPPGLEALLRFDCAELDRQRAAHLAAGRYLKPDNNNEVLVVAALELKGCKYPNSGPESDTFFLGALVTNMVIAESGRYQEACPVMEIGEFVPGLYPDIDKHAEWRALYCSPAPPSRWTDIDADIVQQRVLLQPFFKKLDERYRAAQKAQRLYSPPGDNALELALVGRDLGYGPIVEHYVAQLRGMLPGAIAAAEQALNAGNRMEFWRLVAMIARVDPLLPDVERLRAAAGPGPSLKH
jgi:hypothetical protein